ncbi:MAG: CemA family protein [Synechococcales cyanobacterium M58_A2018_015]|nr:CemA family protein [Synechococcales cyanobacterium M58_A2018_015]
MNLNFSPLHRWLQRRHLRALEAAYEAAQAIQALEMKYANGGKITYTPEQTKTVFDYIKSLRDRQLLKVRTNLAQFQLSGLLVHRPEAVSDCTSEAAMQLEAAVLEKLNFIESIIGKYREDESASLPVNSDEPLPAAPVTPDTATPVDRRDPKNAAARTIDPATIAAYSPSPRRSRFSQRDLPLGFGNELNPNYEQRVVQELRLRRQQNRTAARWLLILLLVPLMVQILVKNLVLEPLLGTYSDRHPTRIELSQAIQEQFLAEFAAVKEKLEIQELIGVIPELTPAQRRQRLEEAAVDLWRDARNQSLNGLKNLMADGIALLTFAGLVYFNRSKLTAIRTVSNQAFLTLSDPAKVFLFILVTDMFVGFHSAEGWEVLLQGVTSHFGLPENPAAVNTFIATVPVIIDSCIKFWIFSYLTRYSPSASAIYERMNT